MILGIYELFQITVTVVALGYIFMNFFVLPSTETRRYKAGKKEFYLSMLAVSPAIVLHELSHKFLGVYFGFDALYNVSYLGLAIGIFFKLMNSRFIFFVPAFVSISGQGQDIGNLLVPLSGPLTNLFLFVISYAVVKFELVRGRKFLVFWASRYINLWLFVLNMLPIPGADGWHVYKYIFANWI